MFLNKMTHQPFSAEFSSQARNFMLYGILQQVNYKLLDFSNFAWLKVVMEMSFVDMDKMIVAKYVRFQSRIEAIIEREVGFF